MSLRQCIGCAVLLLACTGLTTAQSPQPPSPLELVRGLRTAGMPDLALEYLRDHQDRPMPDDDRKAVLLERARCLLEASEFEADEGTRANMVAEAKEGFNQFILKNPTHPRLVEASLSLARLMSMEAKAQLDRAKRMQLPDRNDPGYEAALAKQRQEGMKAQPLFLLAAKNFETAAQQLKARLDDRTLDARTRKALSQEATEAALAAAFNQFYLAETFIKPDAVLAQQRGKFLEDAQSKFARLTAEAPDTPIYWIAQAWKGEILMELSNSPEAQKTFRDILDSRQPESEEGKRMVRFFQIRRDYEAAVTERASAKLQAVEKDIRGWLARYGKGRQSGSEAVSLQYYLAVVLQRQAEIALGAPPKDTGKPVVLSATTRKQLEEAERLYRQLSQSDNDYTTRATRNRMEVVRRLVGEADKGAAEYFTFETAQMAALIQMDRLLTAEQLLTEARSGTPEELGFWATWSGKTRRLSAEVALRRQRVLELLERARELATDKDPPADVTDNLLRLVYFYQNTGQPHQAAVLGEHIARTTKGVGTKASAAGLMALGGYLGAAETIPFDATDPAAAALAQTARQADRDRAARIARFLDDKFPNDTPTDAARHRLALMLAEEERFDQAFEAIVKVRAGYPQLAGARQLEGYIATRLITAQAKDMPMPPGGREAVYRRAIADLERVVKPPPSALEDEVRGYLSVRVRLAQLYLLQSRVDPVAEKASPGYERAIRMTEETLGMLPTFACLTEPGASGAKLNLHGLEMQFLAMDVRTRALFLRGRALLDEGRIDEAAAVLDPIIDEINKTGALVDARIKAWLGGQGDPNDDEATAAQKTRIHGLAAGVDKTRREILMVGFKLRLLQGQAVHAPPLLDLLEKTGGSVEANQPTLEMLARELAGRIAALSNEARTNEARAKELEVLKQGLGILVKRLGSVPNLTPASIAFLGQTLVTVGQYEDALKEFGKIPPPSRPDWATVDATKIADVTERNKLQNEVRYYRFAQLNTIKCLRLLGRLAEAEALAAAAIGTEQKKGYGYGSLDFRKEQAMVWEAKGAATADVKAAGTEWKKALDTWTMLFRSAEKQVSDLPSDATPEQTRQAKSAYFDAYFEIQRIMIEANTQLLKGNPKLADTFTQVGKRIAEMETANKILQAEQDGKSILTPEVWNRYCDLIEKYPELKTAYTAAGGKLFLNRPKQ